MSATASTAKYKAVARGVNSDGRLRGLLQFAGAGRTGRWSGRTFQPQNLPRPDMEQDEIEQCIGAIKGGSIDLVSDNVMRACSNAIRGVIVAPPGKKLVVGDLANIEGRMAAWLAGEEWKLGAFREYDEGVGADLYKVAYGKAFKITPEDVSKPQRQIGKVMELMLQYEGGVGAFLTGAATYGIDLDAMAETALPTIPSQVLQESIDFYDWSNKKRRNTFGLERDTFLACDALKRLWRYAHPAISSYWGELKDAVISAINRPGQAFDARRLVIRRDGAWLKIRLPSGRLLCYPSPQAGDDGKISYMGVNQYSRKWSRISTYGGKLFENITQAAARDVLAADMPLVEAAGYEIVLSVHDELITEAPDTDEYTAEGLCDLMATVPDWAEGLPLASAGFESPRYKKD
jgi:DNA polymerase